VNRICFSILLFATIISSNLSWANWPAGQLTYTTTTQPYCFQGGRPWGQITYYQNWTYTDSSGAPHSFNGTSWEIFGSAANCPAQTIGGFTETHVVRQNRSAF